MLDKKEGNKYISSQVVGDGSKHHNDVLSLDKIAIVAGDTDNNVKIYNITKDIPPKFNLLTTHECEGKVNFCFLYNYENAICVDNVGYVKKYNFVTLQQSDLYYADSGLYSGIQTIYKLIVVGASSIGKIYILDKYGTQINTHTFSISPLKVSVAEVRRNIILTADISGVYLHNITDPYNIPDSTQLFTGNLYYIIISLKSNEGDFAIGGHRMSVNKGFVDIYSLSEGNILKTSKDRGKLVFSLLIKLRN